MIPDSEWNTLSRKAFPHRLVSAPPFLWTRILAGIEAIESRRATTWWMQWNWMGRVTIAVGLLVGLGAYYLFSNTALPLDSVLDGRSSQQQAIQLASDESSQPDETAIILVGLDS